jgi:hypothetical protein
MRKLIAAIFGIAAVFTMLDLFPANAVLPAYPYPQSYATDQRRFDTQQASNLTMRKLQASATDQWAIAVVDVNKYTGLSISTGTDGVITSTETLTATAAPGYAVTKYSFWVVGGTATITSNRTGGVLTLADGMYRERIFDFPVTSPTFTINFSSGALYYSITGVK